MVSGNFSQDLVTSEPINFGFIMHPFIADIFSKKKQIFDTSQRLELNGYRYMRQNEIYTSILDLMSQENCGTKLYFFLK